MPWTEELGGLWSMGLQRVHGIGHEWACMHFTASSQARRNLVCFQPPFCPWKTRGARARVQWRGDWENLAEAQAWPDDRWGSGLGWRLCCRGRPVAGREPSTSHLPQQPPSRMDGSEPGEAVGGQDLLGPRREEVISKRENFCPGPGKCRAVGSSRLWRPCRRTRGAQSPAMSTFLLSSLFSPKTPPEAPATNPEGRWTTLS